MPHLVTGGTLSDLATHRNKEDKELELEELRHSALLKLKRAGLTKAELAALNIDTVIKRSQ